MITDRETELAEGQARGHKHGVTSQDLTPLDAAACCKFYKLPSLSENL